MASRLRRFIPVLAILIGFSVPYLLAQDEESPQEKQYREDYDRVTKIAAIPDPIKRADGLLVFMKERPNSKMDDYAQGNFLSVLDNLVKAENNPALVSLTDRFIKMRPRVGEVYYFQGVALKNQRKFPEAMDSLAKCIVLKNRISSKAREFLEYIYKGQNRGELAGIEKVIQKAQAELGK
jgi:hypothetical protein